MIIMIMILINIAVSCVMSGSRSGINYICAVLDLIPVEARFSASVQIGPGAHAASYTMVTEFFSGVKRPGHVVDYPPSLAPRMKEEYSYTSTPVWAFVACSRAKIYLYL
jgi:hypothetical protein